MCETFFKEILQSGKCTLKNQVDIFVLAQKYQWLDEVLLIAAELLYQKNLSDLRVLDGYEVILEKRLGIIEKGRNYKHYCFFEQRQKAIKVFCKKMLYKLQKSQSVWMADEYRCTKKHWSLSDLLKSPAAYCEPCLISMKHGIEKCFEVHEEDLNIILKEDAKAGELKKRLLFMTYDIN